MGQSKEVALRRKVVEARGEGQSYTALALEYGVGYNTVRSWCHRYAREGETGMVPRYGNCGKRVDVERDGPFRFVRLVAHLHPDWGIPYVLCRIARAYPNLRLQSARHYQRRIKRRAPDVPAPTLPKAQEAQRARVPHEVWQVDAKERIPLSGEKGREVCFLNFTDEKTSGLLKAKSFPPGADQPSGALGNPRAVA